MRKVITIIVGLIVGVLVSFIIINSLKISNMEISPIESCFQSRRLCI